MHLNLYVIHDYLNLQILYCRIQDAPVVCPFDRAALFRSGQVCRPDWLYIVSAEDWLREASQQDGGNFVVVGWTESCPISSGNILGISSDFDLSDVLFEIEQIFYRFQNWELSLYKLLAENAPLKQYGELSLEFAGNPICMYTAGLKTLFFSERKKPRNLRLFTEDDIGSFLPYEDIEGLHLNPEYLQTLDKTEPDIFPDEFWGYRILYDNIRIDGLYVARLMFCEVERPVRLSDYAILRKLSTMLRYSITQQEIPINSHPQHFDNYLLSLIRQQSVHTESFVPVLAEFHWKIEDSYFCIWISTDSYKETFSTVDALCIKLESLVPRSAALMNEASIIFLVNLSAASAGRDEILANLIYLLRESALKAGISTEFHNLLHLYHYYRQASSVLQIGSMSDPTFWYYRYEDYAFRHLLIRAAGDAEIESLCPSGLLSLIAYDRLHNRQYARSLKVYLEENMSITRAVRRLYMQRSTFIYQMKRIREISGLNPEDKSCRFHLLFLFQIMEEKHYALP